MAEQLALPLPIRAASGRQDFLVAPPNATALQTVEDWRSWPGHKLVLIGPQGSGKTHLAHVWSEATEAVVLGMDQIGSFIEAPLSPGECVVVEDADRFLDRHVEPLLLALHNLLNEIRGWLMLTARGPVAKWPVSLPDLRSRLQAAPVARMHEPDDTLLSGLLLKLFEDRQLRVDPAVITYLAARIERSFAAAQTLVDEIDRTAMSEGRAITRRFVSEILENRDMHFG